jgi:hypothetical protein
MKITLTPGDVAENFLPKTQRSVAGAKAQRQKTAKFLQVTQANS